MFRSSKILFSLIWILFVSMFNCTTQPELKSYNAIRAVMEVAGVYILNTAGFNFNVSYTTNQTSELGGTSTITISPKTKPNYNISLSVYTDNTMEGYTTPYILTFTTSNWNVPQTVTVTGMQDSKLDGDTKYNVMFYSSSLDPIYSDAKSQIAFTNLDSYKVIFVSATMTSGGFGSISNADMICANDANKPNDGSTYKAMVVDTSTRRASVSSNAGDGQIDWVLKPNYSYYRSDKTTLVFTANSNGIVLGNWNAAVSITGTFAWTGINALWQCPGAGSTCNFWVGAGTGSSATVTSSLNPGAFGNAGNACAAGQSLYCVQQ